MLFVEVWFSSNLAPTLPAKISFARVQIRDKPHTAACLTENCCSMEPLIESCLVCQFHVLPLVVRLQANYLTLISQFVVSDLHSSKPKSTQFFHQNVSAS